ncbi:hypothetical protein CkaCkLH20_04417 [Colletotrichum karsti]|uniref:Uncharacterized protein n=1 Tax=Colletotrichum karsti TaxID=1095194 RepID=A0A9P6I9V6_9PEZI|nr:uncharacterized protein CkaCkLH20_04417 [Colletotrichum karsti]KAF9877841.1 hypothetical protein CkaCkLH20_04417 [Colletotrichum karsti]
MWFSSARRIWDHITGNDEENEEYLLQAWRNRPPSIAHTISDLDSESGLDPEDAPNRMDSQGNWYYQPSECVVKLRIGHSDCTHARDENGRFYHKGLADETIINSSPHEQMYNATLTALVLNRNADKALEAADELNKNLLEAIVKAKTINNGSWKELEEDEEDEQDETLGASIQSRPKLKLDHIEIASKNAVCQDRCGLFTIEGVRRSSITPPAHIAALRDEIAQMEMDILNLLDGIHIVIMIHPPQGAIFTDEEGIQDAAETLRRLYAMHAAERLRLKALQDQVATDFNKNMKILEEREADLQAQADCFDQSVRDWEDAMLVEKAFVRDMEMLKKREADLQARTKAFGKRVRKWEDAMFYITEYNDAFFAAVFGGAVVLGYVLGRRKIF